MKLTQRDVDQLGPGEYRDDEVPGLVLRVRSTGHRTFALRYTLPATHDRKRLNLGPTAVLTLQAARAEAKKRLGGMYVGVDPAKDLRPSQGPTVGEVVDMYLANTKLSPATLKEWRRIASVEFGAVRDRPAKDLKRAEIRALGASICKRSGYTANRAHVILRAAFKWAIYQDLIEATPFVGLRQPFDGERKSDRVLSPDELRALIFLLDELRKPKREVTTRDGNGELRTHIEVGGDHYADALALLLLTGVRRRAVIEARASELFFLDAEVGDGEEIAEWRIAPERQKMRETRRLNAKPHIVPLSRQAAAILRHRLRAVGRSEVLFPRSRAARSRGRVSVTWSTRWIKKLRERMAEALGRPVPPWKVHNLRHTLATHIEDQLHVAEAITAGILGHKTDRGITSRYALAQRLVERRKALQAWADWLDGLRRSGFKVAGGTAAGASGGPRAAPGQ